ncbi:MAG TPA: DUF5915 domain-containing protein, partial [Actinomycetota bacterium]|nr:DUF5915 domain-containing protein [Actinomycetota bacterium]
KSSGLAVEDRIELWISGDAGVSDALRAHEGLIVREVLATSTSFEAPPEGAAVDEVALGDGSVRVGLRKSG